MFLVISAFPTDGDLETYILHLVAPASLKFSLILKCIQPGEGEESKEMILNQSKFLNKNFKNDTSHFYLHLLDTSNFS